MKGLNNLLILRWPPSVNHYWVQTGKRKFLSKKGREYRDQVIRTVEMISYKLPKMPMQGDIEILIEVYPPDNRRRDLDNLLKAPLDAMEHAGVYTDDNQLADIRIVRKEVIKPGMLKVYLSKALPIAIR